MANEDATYSQITFHFVNGQSESYNLYAPIESDGTNQTTQMEIRHMLKKEWWIVHLPEQTLFINVANVLKVEMKPPLPQLRGDDVFANAERVTALNRPR